MDQIQMEDQLRVADFWERLIELLNSIKSDPENNELINRIDKFISDTTEYDWEYGPSSKTEFYFCLSPNLREDLIEEVERIISLAPKIDGWEFIAGKPRKDEIVPWLMLDDNNLEIMVDPSNWRFILYKFKDNTFDIDVKLNDLNGSLDFQYMAINILLTNALGEKEFMKWIKGINIVTEFAGGPESKTIPIKDIYRVISRHMG
jgi:hypothetical protein